MSLDMVPPVGDTDELTGLPDKAGFDVELETALSKATAAGEELTLVVLDLDHFGAFNETFGRKAGDEVLKRVVEALVASVPAGVNVYRTAGQVFTVLLPRCKNKDAFPVANELRKAITAGKGTVRVTASAGIANFPAHAHSAKGLVSAADEALYASKRGGRNRSTRSTRGSLYRANERRRRLGKEAVLPLKDRAPKKAAPEVKAAVEAPKRARDRSAPWPLRLTAQPPPPGLMKADSGRNIEAELRQIISARMAS